MPILGRMLLPSAYPEVGDRPALRKLLRIQVDMQVTDLATLLCLPREEPGLDGGCNLTATMLATNIIAGASVLFWNSSVEALRNRGDRGKRFTDVVTVHYPWLANDAVTPELGAKLLWDHARNPLSHTLGVGKQAQLFPGIPREEQGVWLSKPHGLTAASVEDLMGAENRPNYMIATVTAEPGGYVISVVTLAWGVTRLLRNLFADSNHADAAETTACRLLGTA